jgi:hypothetical protein
MNGVWQIILFLIIRSFNGLFVPLQPETTEWIISFLECLTCVCNGLKINKINI